MSQPTIRIFKLEIIQADTYIIIYLFLLIYVQRLYYLAALYKLHDDQEIRLK